MRSTKTEERAGDAPAVERAPAGLDAMVLIVESDGTPFAPATIDEGLDLTLAGNGTGWRCDWLEGGCDHA